MHVQGNSFWKSLLIDGAEKSSQRFADHLEHRLYLEVELSRDPGLQVIHIPDLSMHSRSDLQILKHLLDDVEYHCKPQFSKRIFLNPILFPVTRNNSRGIFC